MHNGKIKVFIIGTVGVPAKYGGFESLVENLIGTTDNIDYTVFCSSRNYKKRYREYKSAELKYLPIPANGIWSIFYDFISMMRSLSSNVMLILGVSGCIFLPLIKFLYNGKIIVNVDGVEWKREKWGQLAKILLKRSEKLAVKFADIIISDNRGIKDYIDNEYSCTSVEIPYGTSTVISDKTNYKDKYWFIGTEYAVSVCRIEPENNVDLILSAFEKSNKTPLIFIGNWEASEYGQELKDKYKGHDIINLYDPIYEKDEVDAIRRNATIYIHGHSAGGTNPSLVEAMGLGLSIIAYDCVYNRYTTKDECYYWKTQKDLIEIIDNLDRIDFETRKRVKEIADEIYSWDRIRGMYESLYI